MAQIDFLPVAVAGTANVDTQDEFAGSGYQTNGFTTGTAYPNQANKIWRQSSMMVAALAAFIAAETGQDVLDDGNLAALTNKLSAAIGAAAAAASSTQTVVPYAANPVFDASLSNGGAIQFVMTLQGNVASSSLINVTPGQQIRLILIQDGIGNRTFSPPANMPFDYAIIEPGAGRVSTQSFVVLPDHSLIATSAVMVR